MLNNEQILCLLKEAKTQQEVNLLRSRWVKQNRDDTLFDVHVPEGLK